jgi:benzoyl-CoA reductase subunit B
MSTVSATTPVVKKANRLKATKLNNTLVNQYWEDLFHAKERGQLVCWTEGVAVNPILQAAGIAWCHGEAAAALLAARKESAAPQAYMEQKGYDRELCSYARTHLGCGMMNLDASRQAPPSPTGDLRAMGARIPPPDLIISAYPFCSTGQQWDHEVHRTFGKKVPIFNLSLPWIWGNKPSAKYMSGPEFREAVAFLKRQLEACVAFIEERTGRPYDWDRLREIMAYTKRAAEVRLEAMRLCRARPAPASFFEWTNSIAPVNFLPGGPEIVDYFERKKAEIAARVAEGVGSVPVERYRLWWDGIMNWNKIGWLADKFAGYDAAMVAGRYTHMGFWHEPQVIDLRDPLDGMAQNYLTCPISISAPQVIEKIVELCEKYALDGLILHAARTCRAFSYPQYLIAEAVGKRLGLPVAMFEGDMVDETFYRDEIVNSRVEAMLEAIEARRAKAR